MSWGFERGKVYNRRQDIHVRYGGQQQGGIITPKDHSLIVIITGEEGLGHGYHDRLRDDGVFEYFGEGQKGDMQWLRGNAKLLNHSADGRDLLLFRKTRDGLKFLDQMVCQGFEYRQAPDTENRTRQAIVFELRPLEAIAETVEAAPPAVDDLAALKKYAFTSAGGTRAGAVMRTVYERSRDVRDYVLARAGTNCEGCALPAPFLRANGLPYLEPHHIRRVSDGGPDHPAFVIGLCPNCHRRVHAGADGNDYNEILLLKMKTIEP